MVIHFATVAVYTPRRYTPIMAVHTQIVVSHTPLRAETSCIWYCHMQTGDKTQEKQNT